MTALDIEPAIDVTEELERLRRQLDTATRQNRLLRAVAIADGRFTRAVLEGSGLGGVVSVLSELTGKPAAFFDERLHRLAAAGDREIRLQETDEMRDSVAGLLDRRCRRGWRTACATGGWSRPWTSANGAAAGSSWPSTRRG